MKPKNPAAVALGKRGGLARAKKLTPRQRSESARKAATTGTRAERSARARRAAQARWHSCPSPKLDGDCAGCTDRRSEGTHAGCTRQHGHVGCRLAVKPSRSVRSS
jgi:hypothetical protein